MRSLGDRCGGDFPDEQCSNKMDVAVCIHGHVFIMMRSEAGDRMIAIMDVADAEELLGCLAQALVVARSRLELGEAQGHA
jgi:hypothetical protein